MEAQQILSRFCPKSPSIPIVKHSFSLKFHSLPSSSSYLSIQSQNLEFPSGAFHPTSTAHKEACSSSRRRIWCSGSNSTAEAKEGHEVRSRVTVRKKKLAVFVSGGGSNFRSIHEASKWGSLHGDVHVLVTNKSECGGAEYARNNGIPVILFPKAKDESNGLSPNDLVNTLRFSGPTIHFVDEHYDTGRILAQRVVPVLANDTAEELAARVLKEEHQLYVEVVEALSEERIIWREDGVPLIQSKENPNEFY